MRILAIITGDYGRRHVDNVIKHCPESWTVAVWEAPTVLPPFIDYPEDYVPTDLPPADLVLAFQEHRGVAELVPDVCAVTEASAVIAPIDNENWLPRGLARQLRGWLADDGVACVTPKPLCSLTEHDYLEKRRHRVPYDNALIAEFAGCFGQPDLQVSVDPESRVITAVEVKRDAVCGCARFAAERLVGVSADDAEYEAGMLHHHFPCLASMGIDPDFGDTLMHISGNLLRDNVGEQVKPFKRVSYLRPGAKAE